MDTKEKVQLILAVLLVIAGLFMLIAGLYIPPIGIIHNSVLVAFGEAASFAGSLIGVNFTYQYKLRVKEMEHEKSKDK